ncbi:MAG: anti-sigma factor antagonist [Planctomycetota bacterium]|nr:MAG: anti-sigma factor antagonist [Planctomycetota bacterium]
MSNEHGLIIEIDGAEQPLVRLRGEIDLRSSPMLRERLLDLVERRPQRVILDLSDVQYMDSSGVGTVVELKRRLDRAGAPIVLVGLQPRVRSVFEITKLDQFFKIVDTVEQAQQA